MSRPNFDRLVAPPRTVPLSLRVNAMFGGMAAFAWGVLLVTTPIFWGFVANAEVLAPIVLGASAATTDGQVTATGETRSSEDDTRIHWVDYSYQVPAGPRLSDTVGSLPDGANPEALFGQRNPLRASFSSGAGSSCGSIHFCCALFQGMCAKE